MNLETIEDSYGGLWSMLALVLCVRLLLLFIEVRAKGGIIAYVGQGEADELRQHRGELVVRVILYLRVCALSLIGAVLVGCAFALCYWLSELSGAEMTQMILFKAAWLALVVNAIFLVRGLYKVVKAVK